MQVFDFQYFRWDGVSWSMSVENPQGKAALHKLLWCFGVIGTFRSSQLVGGTICSLGSLVSWLCGRVAKSCLYICDALRRCQWNRADSWLPSTKLVVLFFPGDVAVLLSCGAVYAVTPCSGAQDGFHSDGNAPSSSHTWTSVKVSVRSMDKPWYKAWLISLHFCMKQWNIETWNRAVLMADFLLKVCKDCFDIFPLLTWHGHILFYMSFLTYIALSLAQTKQYHKLA